MSSTPFAEPATVAAMLSVVERAYPARVEEYVADRLEHLLRWFPAVFATVDVDVFRQEVERHWRAIELDDWPGHQGGGDDAA